MAFTDAQKAQIVQNLGWPARTIIEGSTDYSKIFADRLVGLGTTVEAMAIALLTAITAVETRLSTAQQRLAAKRVDSIETNPDEIPMLKSERTRLARELGSLLGISLRLKSGVNVSVIV